MINLKHLLTEKVFHSLWHGTDNSMQFNDFNLQGDTYLGVYATSDKDYAKNFGHHLIGLDMTLHRPFYLDLDQPTSVSNTSAKYGEMVLGNKIIGFYRKLTQEAIDILKANGYDGIVIKYKNNPTFEVVAFDPKSVGINK